MVTLTLVSLALALAQEETRDFDAFYREFVAKRDGIQSLEARFVQQTTTPDDNVTSEGTITYTKPKWLLMRYDDPQLAFLNDGARLYQYDAESKQLEIYDIEDRPEAAAFFLGFENNADKLQEAYRVRLLPYTGVDGPGAAIELTPVDDEDAIFQRVVLSLRGKDLLPVEIRIENDADSEVYYKISDLKVNGITEPNQANLFVPEGTMILDNEKYVETVGVGGKWIAPAEKSPPEP